MGKTTLLVLLVTLTATAVCASFQDIPPTHWAHKAVMRVADAGILQGMDGKFFGNRTLNRYQMATVVNKMLEAIEDMGPGKTVAPAVITDLQKLSEEFAGELTEIVGRLTEIEGRLDKLEANEPVKDGAPVKEDAAVIKSRRGKEIKIGGIVKSWWRDLDNQNADEFDLRNARLLVLGKLSRDIKFLIQTDGAHDQTTGANNPSVLDMKLTFNLQQKDPWKTMLTFGRFIPFFTRYQCVAINTIDFVHYPLYLQRGLAVWRQSGLEFVHLNRNCEWKFLMGMVNGSQLNDNNWTGDIDTAAAGAGGNNDGKDIYVRADYCKKDAPLVGSIGYWTGDWGPNDLDRERITAFLEYRSKPWRALIEWFDATSETAPGVDLDQDAFVFQIIHHKEGSRLEYLARYETYDPNCDNANDEETWLTLGINWFLEGRDCFLGLNYIDKENEGAAPGAQDDKEIVAQMTFIF